MSGEPASHWEELLDLALQIIMRANSGGPVIENWTLGGGTALMLQLDHRESFDIDIFLDDPQALAFLDPGRRDFALSTPFDGHDGDGARFAKFAFNGLGEIDFICAASLTDVPARPFAIGKRKILLETPEEIAAKKIVYRGAALQPRDMFDIAAILQAHGPARLAAALAPYETACETALKTARGMSGQFAETIMKALMIRPGGKHLAETARAAVIGFLAQTLE